MFDLDEPQYTMRNRGLFFSALLMASLYASPSTAQGAGIELGELLKHTHRRSPTLRALRTQNPEAAAQLRRSWSFWRPNISASAAGQYTTAEAQFGLGDLAAGLAPPLGLDPVALQGAFPPPIDIQPAWSATVGVRVRQLIFDPQAFYGVSVAREGTRAAEASVVAAENDILFGVVRIALGLKSLDELEAAAVRAEEVAERRVDNARAQARAGTSTSLDVSRAETARLEAQRELEGVRAERARVRAELESLSGWEGRLPRVETADYRALLQGGSGALQRPRLKALSAQLGVSTRERRSAERRWLPTVFLQGDLSWATFASFADEQTVASAILGLELPLYDGGERFALTDGARAREVRASAELDAERLRLLAEEEQARASLAEARIQRDLAQAQLGTATTAVQQTEALFDAGVATSLDLRTADSERFSAEQLLAERTLALELADLELARAQGARWIVSEDS
ncbi:MAG: TolC family protein [Myxococcota bacterium]